LLIQLFIPPFPFEGKNKKSESILDDSFYFALSEQKIHQNISKKQNQNSL